MRGSILLSEKGPPESNIAFSYIGRRQRSSVKKEASIEGRWAKTRNAISGMAEFGRQIQEVCGRRRTVIAVILFVTEIQTHSHTQRKKQTYRHTKNDYEWRVLIGSHMSVVTRASSKSLLGGGREVKNGRTEGEGGVECFLLHESILVVWKCL